MNPPGKRAVPPSFWINLSLFLNFVALTLLMIAFRQIIVFGTLVLDLQQQAIELRHHVKALERGRPNPERPLSSGNDRHAKDANAPRR